MGQRGRKARPWFRTADGWWYATVAGRQIRLVQGADKGAEAEKKWHQLLACAEAPALKAENTVRTLAEHYLGHLEAKGKELDTRRMRKLFLDSFVRMFPGLKVSELIPYHVETWLAKNDGWRSEGTRFQAVASLKAALNLAVRNGLIPSNPLAHYTVPVGHARTADALVSTEMHQRMLAGAEHECFRDLLTGLWETGARPGELARATAADLHGNVLVLRKHKTAEKTGRPRVIALNARAAELLARLAVRHPTGPLFRNLRGRPWSCSAIVRRFMRLRERLSLPPTISAYSYRHSFGHDALMNGVPDAKVAALMGHTSTVMLHRNYSHMTESVRALADEVSRIR